MKRKHLIIPLLLALILLVAVAAPLLAQSGNTWYIQYYNNPNWSGSPVMVAYNTYIDFNWGEGSPGPAVPADNWTATMTSSAYFSSGTYYFSALADDEISLQIDGVTYLNTIGAGMSGKSVSVGVPLAQGTHNLLVQYREYTGAAYVYLSWSYNKPGTTPTVVPPPPPPVSTPSCDPWWSCSCPTQATSVTTQYGNYTACIQENKHQSNCFVTDGQWDSPNMGSIQMEPQIQVCGNCTPGALQCMQLACNQAPVQATCSKTAAGWFYFGPCPSSTPAP